jgi:hypothetical protein
MGRRRALPSSLVLAFPERLAAKATLLAQRRRARPGAAVGGMTRRQRCVSLPLVAGTVPCGTAASVRGVSWSVGEKPRPSLVSPFVVLVGLVVLLVLLVLVVVLRLVLLLQTLRGSWPAPSLFRPCPPSSICYRLCKLRRLVCDLPPEVGQLQLITDARNAQRSRGARSCRR